MTNTTYRTAVVGLTGIGARRAPVVSGGLRRPMGRSHVSCYVEHPRTELVGVCDLRAEALDEFREMWPDLPDVAIHTDFATLLAEQQPDIVSVVTGDHVHAGLTVAAAEAGARAIFCEKPIATTLEDADRMIEACEREGVLLSVDHTRRWSASHSEAQRMVASGALGAVRTVAVEHYGPRAMMFRNGTHMIDLLCFFAGAEPRWVTAQLEPGFDHFDRYRGDGGKDPAQDPYATALIGFEDDIRGIYSGYKTEFNAGILSITCERGRVEFYNEHGRILTSDGTGMHRELRAADLVPGDYLYVTQLAAVDELVAALDAGSGTLVSPGTDARWTLEILLGVLASQQNGHNRVDLPLPRSGN
ncbi:MAG: Gfo/Idh/MocA family oxidoreductase [Spirochaetaceae bacterium]|nr:Gfo/Idh/MocA family oxidoreductase [Spirochaetaceae bacterium]